MQPTAIFAQMRPFREGGNLLSKVKTGGKVIIHNYGHGGAGVSLAPASGIEAVKLAEAENKTNIAIIGCGVVGLFTAKYFIEAYPKLPLMIYSERVPNLDEAKDNSKIITSQAAPGYWLPYA